MPASTAAKRREEGMFDAVEDRRLELLDGVRHPRDPQHLVGVVATVRVRIAVRDNVRVCGDGCSAFEALEVEIGGLVVCEEHLRQGWGGGTSTEASRNQHALQRSLCTHSKLQQVRGGGEGVTQHVV